MTGRTRALVRDARGMTAIEVIVSLTILSTVLLGIAATTRTAARSLVAGRLDVENASAIQYQAEMLMAQPFDSLKSGSATVDGVPCSWAVSGTEIKTVELVANVTNAYGDVVADTTILFRVDPDR